ncbi:hypothetical protein HK097_004009 [Rhizophlyctis rosea]|uniref:Solute carrier family 25 member 38 n=1 Tax=Rhizophlyctis rosea TaxID=64517 RepID=A0AAD5XAG7_9FUNG|nr:hypothetical protein HK097_004009 [Rhizophlyctis rosea]
MGKKSDVDPVLHLVGGAVAGAASCVLLQPLDLIKTRLQQDIYQRKTLGDLSTKGARALSELTIWTTFRKTVQNEGAWGLWRGTVPTIFRNVPGSALYFMTLDQMRTGLRKVNMVTANHGIMKINEGTVNLIGGAAARGGVGFLLMPLMIIKVRYESNLYSYSSMWEATRSIMKEGGIRAFFYGFGATALRDAPYAGLYVFFYEKSKELLHCETLIVDGLAA